MKNNIIIKNIIKNNIIIKNIIKNNIIIKTSSNYMKYIYIIYILLLSFFLIFIITLILLMLPTKPTAAPAAPAVEATPTATPAVEATPTATPAVAPTATPAVAPTATPAVAPLSCLPGYYDTTGGNMKNWECGKNCIGGPNLTNTNCSCACEPINPTATPVVALKKCLPGYYDTTGGNMKNWECGKNCIGGPNLTDTKCSCACKPIK